MNKEKIISYIQLINTTGIGPIGFKKMMDRYKDVDKALVELSQKKELFSRSLAEQEVMKAEIKHIHIIILEDELYPYNLKQIEDCPPVLYALGDISILQNNNALAVVGSRSASFVATKMAQKISSDVSKNCITIVSGMARGIDSASHEGAISSGGKTIAVLGTGVDVVYPKENQNLYNQIQKHGLILSEYPLGTPPQASNFPRRNRIVSGLSKGVLVIEAGLKSGSLITANQALEQGRDVYAIPGAPFDGRTSGCNKLLKDGAIFVETSDDILNNFSFTEKEFISCKPKKYENQELFEYSLDNEENNKDIADNIDEYSELLLLISQSGTDVDEIIRSSNRPSEEILIMIMELELEGKIVRLPGNKIAKA